MSKNPEPLFKRGDTIKVKNKLLTVLGSVESIDGSKNYYICANCRGEVVQYKMLYLDDENKPVPQSCINIQTDKLKPISLYKSAININHNKSDEIINGIPKCISEEELVRLSLGLIKYHPVKIRN